MRKLLKIKLIAILLLSMLNSGLGARAAASPSSNGLSQLPANIASKFFEMDFVSGEIPDLKAFMYNKDEVIDLRKQSMVRFAINAKSLLKSKNPYSSFKVELYEVLPGGERLFITSQTLTKEKKDKKLAVFNMDLNRFDTNFKNIELAVYDSDFHLVNTYSTQLSAAHLDSQGQAVDDEIVAAECDNTTFSECHLDYIFNHLSFEARPQTQVSTRVLKGEDGKYVVTIPVSKNSFTPVNGTNLRTIRGVTIRDNTVVSNGTLFVSENGTAIHYNEELNQLEFKFPGHDEASQVFTHDGRAGLGVIEPTAILDLKATDGVYAPLRFNNGALLEQAPDGAVEFDGNKLYITIGGVRQNLAFGHEIDTARNSFVFTGPVTDDQLPSAMADKTINNLTVTGDFTIPGGSPGAGKFLTADSNGLTYWDTPGGAGPAALAILNHAMNGYAINGAQASVVALSSATTLINGMELLERNAQIDRASISALDTELDSVVAGLAAGTSFDVLMSGEVTGTNNGTVINGLSMYAKQLKAGQAAGLFTPGAGAVTNGDTLLTALQKIVGNTTVNTASIATNAANIATNTANIATNTANIATNTAAIATNTADIATNTADIADIQGDLANGNIALALNGDVTGLANGTSLNGLALFAKQLKIGHASGLFTPGAGAVTNGDTILGALQKIVGNTTANTASIATNAANIATNTANIATNTANIATNTADIAAHEISIDTHEVTLSDILNGDQAIPISGDLTGFSNGVTLNGFALYDLELKVGNGLGLFTPGPGNQTLNNGDSLIQAIEKIAGNVDRNEADIVTTATTVAAHAGTIAAHTATLASHTTSISTLTSDISDIENGDTLIPMGGEIGGTTGAATINGVSMFTKQLKDGIASRLFTPGAGAVTNGDTLLSALQKMVGNTTTNATNITSNSAAIAALSGTVNSLSADVTDIVNGDTAIPLAGAITGTTAASTINGLSLFAIQLNEARANGLFTPAAGAITNGDTIVGVLEKIVGNVNQNTTDIATINNGASLNGFVMYSKQLKEGNGSGLFTAGPGNQAITNADTLHAALQKIVGNIDLTETNIATNTASIATNAANISAANQNISDLANGDDAFTTMTLEQTGNADVLLTNNGGHLEANGVRVLSVTQVVGLDPEEAVHISNGDSVIAATDYTDVDGVGTAATAIKLISDKVGGQMVTLNLSVVGPDLVPTSYVLNGVETNFGTIPDSLADAWEVPGQDYKLYVSGNKVRVLNVDPFSGVLGNSSFTKKTIRVRYQAFD